MIKRYYKTLEEYVEATPQASKWPRRIQEIFWDADAISINDRWVEAKFSENDYIPVYKRIISKLKTMIDNAERFHVEFDYDINGMLKKYKELLGAELDEIKRWYIDN